MSYPYKDFREYIDSLDQKGLLVRVDKQINKDTELVPLVRLQFRGLPEDDRRAFLFSNVTDSNGRTFDGFVAIGTFASSKQVYLNAINAAADAVGQTWGKAFSSPIKPVVVDGGPCKEVVIKGEDIIATGGVDAFPHPISTPGFDPAAYLTSPFWVTKDIETGIYNVGVYRGMVKGPDKIGLQMDTPAQHISQHLDKARKQGKHLEAAIVLGAVPALGLASVQKVPYGVSEYDVAGALMGEPMELVACETVDLEVPAHAEIVIEGEIHSDYLENEGPFGEVSGYMGLGTSSPVFHVKCITHRKKPILQAFISEMPPNESTMMRKIGFENVYRNFLKNNCNIASVKNVNVYEMGACNMMFVVQLDNPLPGQARQALYAVSGYEPSMGKIVIAVDGDIDPGDMNSVIWALSFRMLPHLDIEVLRGKLPRLDPMAAVEGASSALLIDATRPFAFPPTSLPDKRYMENAVSIWQELGLPALSLKEPWHGYELGNWSDENRRDAELATSSRYLEKQYTSKFL
jgi:4-hydroxy-3-polyprenylbenzoate decarboxylase